MLRTIFSSMRPLQWTKNLFVFAGLLFSREFHHPESILYAVAAFILFCTSSGAVYILNDLIDLEEDQKHPHKKKRPLAAGEITARTALVSTLILIAVSVGAALLLSPRFALVIAGYLALMIAYSLLLRKVVILDVLTISVGFLLRAVGGAVILGVRISPWLLICTIFLSLFLILCKRRHEVVATLKGEREQSRSVIASYSSHLLDQMIAVVTSSTVISFSLYTLAERTQHEVSRHLYLTIPFVLYGIFRYLYLVYKREEGERPEMALIFDRPLIAGILLWSLSIVIILSIGV